jgi:hypothetical protein
MTKARFETSTAADAPIEEIELSLKEEFSRRGLKVEHIRVEESLGMTGAEIIIGIAISFRSSVAAHLLRTRSMRLLRRLQKQRKPLCAF